MSTQSPGRTSPGTIGRPVADAPPARGIPGVLVALFAITAGLSAANTYYAQPLLTAIAGTFHVGSAAASLVATAGPVGYALGLALLVPLGDNLDRRTLAVSMLGVVSAFQLIAAAAPALWVLVGAEVVAAVVSTVSPLMVAFAATLALPHERGRVTGAVMSGVLLGVLMARTAGGLVAQIGGWRLVYALAAVLVAVIAMVLWRVVPKMPPAARVPYRQLLGSTVTLLRQEPVLRLRTGYGFFSQAGFQVLWTSMAFLLAKPPYSFSAGLIGLFGLAGVVGAVAARITGPLADRGLVRFSSGALLALILVSWVLMGLHGGGWLIAVTVGVIALDFGVQGMQVMNLSTIYQLRPDARSRLTTAYMTIYLIGGIAGSSASAAAYALGGWIAVCVVGGVFAAAALLLWVLAEVVRPSR